MALEVLAMVLIAGGIVAVNATGVGVAVSGASTSAGNGHDFPPEGEIALRSVATTCDSGGKPGQCTRTNFELDTSISTVFDETIDSEVAYDGLWLLGVVESKSSSYPILSDLNILKFFRPAGFKDGELLYDDNSLPHPLENCWLPKLLKRAITLLEQLQQHVLWSVGGKERRGSSLLLSSWRSFCLRSTCITGQFTTPENHPSFD